MKPYLGIEYPTGQITLALSWDALPSKGHYQVRMLTHDTLIQYNGESWQDSWQAQDKPVTSQMEQEAATLAMQWHGSQTYGQRLPYPYHLLEVVRLVKMWPSHTQADVLTAWHHDLLEDTAFDHDVYKKVYGLAAYERVWACTGVGENRKEKQHAIHLKLMAHQEAIPTKCADRMVNMKNSQGLEKLGTMYANELDNWSDVLDTKIATWWKPRFLQIHNDLKQSIEYKNETISPT